jgi:hypothetical protein
MAELVQGGLHQAERNRRRRHRRSDAEVVMKQLALTRLALVASTLLGLGMAAYADYTIRDAETGQPIVVEAFDCGGKVCPQSTLVDQFGQPIGIAGNPFFFGGTVQANLTTFAAAPVATLQRSANTTTYTVNTAWNNSAAPAFFTFANACSGNGKQVLVPQIDMVDGEPCAEAPGRPVAVLRSADDEYRRQRQLRYRTGRLRQPDRSVERHRLCAGEQPSRGRDEQRRLSGRQHLPDAMRPELDVDHRNGPGHAWLRPGLG